MKTNLLLSLLLAAAACAAAAQESPKREFRGAWIQCVNGQYLNKTSEDIRRMLGAQLDVLEQANINAVMFQVRAECDALYKSSFEPWSRYLTGRQGLAPSDGWDPLAWMVDECHRRGMECHAWINPYRAKTKGTGELSPRHVAARHPERVFAYGDLLILNPALEANRLHTCMVVEDIIQNYDVDGIHMDDYFYPYPAAGQRIPDEADFQRDPRGCKDIADWRRKNVDLLIRDIHDLIRTEKPWVKFGISPFGIYRNAPDGKNSARGSATSGTQNYDDLYADVVLWQKKGWVDYLVPQIYWNFGNRAADYGVLCRWWNDHCGNRPLYVGQDVERTVKASDPDNPQRHQIFAKLDLQRSLPNIQGSCMWYAEALARNPGNYRAVLQRQYHARPALQPLMPFIDKKAPKRVRDLRAMPARGGHTLFWTPAKAKKELDRAVSYAIYAFPQGEKADVGTSARLLKVTRRNSVSLGGEYAGHTIAVTALDHLHNESKPARIRLR